MKKILFLTVLICTYVSAEENPNYQMRWLEMNANYESSYPQSEYSLSKQNRGYVIPATIVTVGYFTGFALRHYNVIDNVTRDNIGFVTITATVVSCIVVYIVEENLYKKTGKYRRK